ncbi:hypothetical protein BEL04_23515 [Mucilaginibacter sp. PPCGB 2223]|uniref:sensor histidine kinase n=1 Tax=Mucilaginibacter sp. PPCGB 2223 TaxID=1886027 RepID=UPI000825657B|nr:ATP-binding protein [Mucilaginibacter sp. PPCGB 2223]OCX50280.1 hypothetical protein BEL04_23515 [Mucilaginibacter sp. PPCGB 2223]
MNSAAKIRWLLALICLSLFLTAIIARKTYSPGNNLASSAKTLETHLHQKEEFVAGYLNDPDNFNRLKNVNNDETFALQLVDVAKSEKIYAATYNHNQLSYWSGIRVLPDDASLVSEGHSFIRQPNGYYEAIKKTAGDFSAIFFIPVKNKYNYQNTYLRNTFSTDLLQDDNIALTDDSDKKGYDIYSYDHRYLFSVKLIANNPNPFFSRIQILLWLSGLLLLCALTHNLAHRVAKRGYIFSSFGIIGVFIIALRFINLYYKWPDIYSDLPLFDPSYYGSNTGFPSLGDFVINVLLLTWFSVFVYLNRTRLIRPVQDKVRSYAICVGCVLFLIGISTALLVLFKTLIFNSNINFDVNNVLNLTSFSIVGVITLCFGFLIFVLFSETVLYLNLKLNVPHVHKLIIFLSLIFTVTAYQIIRKDYSDFYLLWSLLVIIRGYAVFYDSGKFSALTYIGIIIICSSVSSVKLYVFQSAKEKETRKILAQKLESASDPAAEYLFTQIEDQILTDSVVFKYFKDHSHNQGYLHNRFQKLYFDGYLSKYDVKTYEYDNQDRWISGSELFDLNDFKQLVQVSAIKVAHTRYFYQPNNTFGFQNYFAMIPIQTDSSTLGTLVIGLESKPFRSTEPFPELLTESPLNQPDDFKGYSYAFYSDGKLLNQSGKYIYSLANFDFSGKLKQYVYKSTVGDGGSGADKTHYSHLIYQPSERDIIVITKEDDMFYSGITSLTFFFLVFLAFTLILLGLIYLWKNYRTLIKIKSVKWMFWENFDKVLYKTRIQVSMVFAVVITLFIIGVITFLSVRNQYISQQDEIIHDKMARISIAFEKLSLAKNISEAGTESAQLEFNTFANTYSADLTLYDKEGRELLTTQPKLYEAGLIEPRMNAKAFIYSSRLQKSGFINPEVIGTLDYKAAYAPLRTAKHDIIGFLQLPYFANEAEYRERVGAFLNTMINVYALVFIAIGLFAIVVARQITTPLTLIQQSLSNTIYGRKNEPIQWQHNDEIGSLIKEYNKMIAALENSAQKLAQSERENAWREMAKQVAHEIKNPLTPLKLGLQLLEKAWRDKDPKFDLKFERFSKSFVEQIDSLSRIASEFSNFAKMPETRVERFNIFDIITQATNIFKQTDNLDIVYEPANSDFYIMADKDQILRCFNNLLKNAIEAVPAERRGVVRIDYNIAGNEIHIRITDNGSGIPEALRERIFAPNFTTKSSGTGLGLALVKNAIEYAGGTISFDTELGKGTTFYISFQAAT